MFIGDVTGHGLPAAFIGAMTKMALAYADKSSPETMFREMNDGMADLMPPGRFVTVAAALYNPETGGLKVARGGHPPPFVWRKETGEVEQILPKGMALGMLAGVSFELFETSLNPGDRFLLMTDGITETTDMNNEMLGIEGSAELFKKWVHLPMDQNLDKILEEQFEFAGGRILKDDNTLIGLECVRLGAKEEAKPKEEISE
jgi:serine phosphatase RsbU (regulator of sigma subunit)